jgi:hypothetical protein
LYRFWPSSVVSPLLSYLAQNPEPLFLQQETLD